MNIKEWNFKVFISLDGKNEINDWIEGFSLNDQNRIRLIIKHLETQKDMSSKWFSGWRNHPYLYRIKLRFHKDLYRLFGCFGPNDNNEFTLLIPAKKDAGRLIPRNAPEIAETRCKLIHEDRRYIDDFV